jgi:GGDEF domain-containing protein/ActR/RegA family two-component response regulator
MFRTAPQNILLIGDDDRQVWGVLSQSMPTAECTRVATFFDGIAELSARRFTAVLAAVEPIERRPESAINALRDVAQDTRLLVFAEPSLEPLANKLLQFGCDDYLISPVTPADLLKAVSTPPLRLTPGKLNGADADDLDNRDSASDAPAAARLFPAGAELATALLEALVHANGAALPQAVDRINQRLTHPSDNASPQSSPRLSLIGVGQTPAADQVIRALPGDETGQSLCLSNIAPNRREHGEAFLAELAPLMSNVATLQERHNKLQRLAITDDLTGAYNCRYFRHYLTKIIEKAKALRFPVTLFLFDIDDFKQYNDQYGHGVGDEILKQTAALMKRCVRDHDLVARIGGDEFAVVFWEKEGPRTSHHASGGVPGRPPSEPRQILERFRKLLATEDFQGIGPGGKGQLTISGGLASLMWDGNDVESLIAAADKKLMFGAKKAGKNVISLVGPPLP